MQVAAPGEARARAPLGVAEGTRGGNAPGHASTTLTESTIEAMRPLPVPLTVG